MHKTRALSTPKSSLKKPIAPLPGEEDDQMCSPKDYATPEKRGKIEWDRDSPQVRFEYNLHARSALNKYFGGWLEHHVRQKEKWGALVKYRYLVTRMRVNKLFWGWRIQVRQGKVNRLKVSIIEHSRYQATIRKCFGAWKRELARYKTGIQLMRRAIKSMHQSLALAKLKHHSEDQLIKQI